MRPGRFLVGEVRHNMVNQWRETDGHAPSDISSSSTASTATVPNSLLATADEVIE
jgi:hypothetical protein